ncbi:hypothetical protein DACRYDRAFT_57745 [Dacryopinax primogenitus]|uniref:S-adenosyl-L-methionine-dependent methyltransferase n=1 Tax=Dacryopinax primogenitus (strain DJM 731) TaxID=1858805 RepID=M5FS08_DACPD|nr:uncharacterized protein DACRYDRAFT_57745 [Dacryopinax primogenitus]EJT98558.1 hypothetical protein DACRYDRAFT_57745 [Dacryopinax primogenitus]
MWLPLFLDPLPQLLYCIKLGLPPVLRALYSNPWLIFYPSKLQKIFMAGFWVVFGPGLDEGAAPAKQRLITPFAKGVVLEIGAGHGHSLRYFDREKVEKYFALEPNEEMYPALRKSIADAGLSEEDGTAIILPFGAHEVDKILAAVGENQVDTLVSFLTLCSVPNSKEVIPKLCLAVLKRPGGTFLMYEHGLSPVWSSRIYQRFWSPIWSLTWNGCRLDRNTVKWVEQVPWAEKEVGKEDMPDWHLWYRTMGRYVL